LKSQNASVVREEVRKLKKAYNKDTVANKKPKKAIAWFQK
jgi:hypothetical protein